jgi:hypothetical protein
LVRTTVSRQLAETLALLDRKTARAILNADVNAHSADRRLKADHTCCVADARVIADAPSLNGVRCEFIDSANAHTANETTQHPALRPITVCFPTFSFEHESTVDCYFSVRCSSSSAGLATLACSKVMAPCRMLTPTRSIWQSQSASEPESDPLPRQTELPGSVFQISQGPVTDR